MQVSIYPLSKDWSIAVVQKLTSKPFPLFSGSPILPFPWTFQTKIIPGIDRAQIELIDERGGYSEPKIDARRKEGV